MSTEPVRFLCPSCGKRLKAAPDHVGKKARCSCGHGTTVPALSSVKKLKSKPTSNDSLDLSGKGKEFRAVRRSHTYIRSALFACWFIAGLLVLVWYISEMLGSNVHIYTLNGYDQPVIVLYQNAEVARLLPDEARLIRLKRKGEQLEVETAEGREAMGQLDNGAYLLNLGKAYWVSHKRVVFSNSPLPPSGDLTKYDQPGLFRISTLAHPVWEVYEFDEDLPGSITGKYGASRLKIACGSVTGRRPIRHAGLMNALTLDKEWGETGVLLPGAVILVVWIVGLRLFYLRLKQV